MSAGHAPAGSSPQIQEEMELNRDATFRPRRGTEE
jgi:hypothetical protein